ncbi:hypothetical protein AB0J47_41785 [Nocardia sp. NPDC049737]|uniref:hypothetical protein n=1 Tax=Nocardia sp. NPDC049737 TaxID=3154358 RepID=UPI0034294405
MSDRQPPSEFTQALVQGLGMLGLLAVAVFVLKGLRTGSIRPAEIAAQVPHYRDVFLDALAPTLGAVAGLVVLASVGLLMARGGRTLLAVWWRTYWRYRRRWDAVMADHELTAKKAGLHEVPQLRTVTAFGSSDVVRVRMLSSQSPKDWADNVGDLATAFGATSGEVRPAEERSDIDLVFTRGGGKPTYQRELLPGGGQVIALPGMSERTKRPVAIQVKAGSLQLTWAFVRVREHNGANRRYWGVQGRRWSKWQAFQGWSVPSSATTA